MITSQFDGLPYETCEHFSLRSYFPRPYVHFSEKVPVNLRNVRVKPKSVIIILDMLAVNEMK